MALKKPDEKILVIPRDIIFASGAFQGFLPVQDFVAYEKLITQHQQFQWRSGMENDPSYKQIIPYLVFRYQDTYFVMQRRSDASEARLQSKLSLGIGGHIRQEDMQDSSLITWARREFNEEVSYSGNLSIEPLGLINDDLNAVGQVHLGFAFLLTGDSFDIHIKSELKDGKLLSIDQMKQSYDHMEWWSQLVFDYLVLRNENKQSSCQSGSQSTANSY
jgi:predicted NUDIX family phosphoesterase